MKKLILLTLCFVSVSHLAYADALWPTVTKKLSKIQQESLSAALASISSADPEDIPEVSHRVDENIIKVTVDFEPHKTTPRYEAFHRVTCSMGDGDLWICTGKDLKAHYLPPVEVEKLTGIIINEDKIIYHSGITEQDAVRIAEFVKSLPSLHNLEDRSIPTGHPCYSTLNKVQSCAVTDITDILKKSDGLFTVSSSNGNHTGTEFLIKQECHNGGCKLLLKELGNWMQ